jgi:hypothetical protein
MWTRVIVLTMGITTAVLGCATKEVRDSQLAYLRVTPRTPPASVQNPGWNGAITVNPERVLGN